MASETEELNFKFHLILINLNLNSHAWLLTTVLRQHQLTVTQRKTFLNKRALGFLLTL